MKKTLVLTHDYYPFPGGIARYCYNLFMHYPRESYLVMTDRREAASELVVVKTLTTKGFRPSWIVGLMNTLQVVGRHKIERIFTPNILPLGRIALYVKTVRKIPYIISLHGLDINLALERKKRVTTEILRNAEHIIVNSEATKKILDPLALATPVSIITPCLDNLDHFIDERIARSLSKRFARKKIILTVGRLVKRKGQDMIIQAMPAILKEVPDAHYIIVGEGPEHAYLDELIVERRLLEHVTIVSDVADDHLGAYFSVSRVFAMPTRKIGPDVEGFGMVYLAAAAFGLPVIAGDSGGENEAAGDSTCALQVNGRSLEQITESLVCLLQDEELSRYLGTNAKNRLRELPTWEEQSSKLRAILS